jgi:predicted PurR-regulated permease PerM
LRSTRQPRQCLTARPDQPPVIRRAEVVAFALVALLIIAIATVLYSQRPSSFPSPPHSLSALWSPAAGYLERRHVPRAVSAVLIAVAGCAALAFFVGLIASPLMEWSTRLPELGELLKEKMHMFDRPLALWRQLQGMLGGSETLPGSPFQMPKFDWVQPTFEFLSPTLTEFLLFAATLILFIASWRDLRRALVMTFGDRDSGLRTLRILNEIEGTLGGYLLMVTVINLGVGAATGTICAATVMPNPAGLGALAAT